MLKPDPTKTPGSYNGFLDKVKAEEEDSIAEENTHVKKKRAIREKNILFILCKMFFEITLYISSFPG